MTKPSTPNPFNETPEVARARRSRSWAIALGLLAFVALVFIVTMVRLTHNVG